MVRIPRGSIETRKNLPPHLSKLYEEHQLASNTQRGYGGDIRGFWEWCKVNEKEFLPCSATDLCEFLAEHSEEYSHSALSRWTSAISWMHREAGYDGESNPRKNPLVSDTLKKIARKKKEKKPKQARELTVEDIQQLITVCQKDENKLKGARDRALFLLGFSSALRVSNLVTLQVEHLKFVIEGLELEIPSSKNDQEGQGHLVLIPKGEVPATCPLRATQDWLRASNIKSGFIVRRVYKTRENSLKKAIGESLSAKAVTMILQSRLREAGYGNWKEYSSHSFRSGWATTAARAGVSMQAIMSQGNWASATTAMRYIRKGSRWADQKSIGL